MSLQCFRCKSTEFSAHAKTYEGQPSCIWLCGDCCRSFRDLLREWKIWTSTDDIWLDLHNTTFWSKDWWGNPEHDTEKHFEKLMSISLCCPQCGEIHQ